MFIRITYQSQLSDWGGNNYNHLKIELYRGYSQRFFNRKQNQG